MKLTYLLAALILGIPGLCAAKDVSIVGAGYASCGKWSAQPKSSVGYLEQQEWLWGYVSGFNYFVQGNGNVGGGTDGYGMSAWVDGYCAKHPLETVFQAANALIVQLAGREKTSN
jgi:hypothetical protein